VLTAFTAFRSIIYFEANTYATSSSFPPKLLRPFIIGPLRLRFSSILRVRYMYELQWLITILGRYNILCFVYIYHRMVHFLCVGVDFFILFFCVYLNTRNLFNLVNFNDPISRRTLRVLQPSPRSWLNIQYWLK